MSRGVVYKHTAAGLFGEGAYVLASVAASAPLSIGSDLLFATPLYFIAQYTEVRWRGKACSLRASRRGA